MAILQPDRALPSSSPRRPRCMSTALPISRPRRRRPRRCARSPASSPSSIFALGIVGTGLWPCRCWRARPRMRSGRRAAGRSAWPKAMEAAGVLCHARAGDDGRHAAQFHAYRPDQSTVLERIDQRRGRRAGHGHDDVDRGTLLVAYPNGLAAHLAEQADIDPDQLIAARTGSLPDRTRRRRWPSSSCAHGPSSAGSG